jgi:hypothetical protein
MSMQATGLPQKELASGTFEAKKSRDETDRSAPDSRHTPDSLAVSGAVSVGIPRAITAPDSITEARDLAQRIEELLTPRSGEAEPYGVRLARALAQSLADQLADLSRDSKRPKSV